MAIDYRQARTTDLHQLLPLVEAYALDQQAQMPINSLTERFMEYARAGMAQAVEHPAGCVMVAEETTDGAPRIVGYAVGMAQEPPAIFEPEIYTFITDLYVVPDYRRQGIGTGLVERVRGWGWVKGINRLSVVLPEGNAGRGLLAKLGFRPVQTMFYSGERD
ncbi:MAG TPA: GNAT family N-acetyltransferase [Symbiobacteriaceae bacterium]|jgi:GNAT superfamily N-acetyltransferase